MPIGPLEIISLGMNLIGGLQQKAAADKAAKAAQEVGEFNAQIIERNVDLLGKQSDLIGQNLEIAKARGQTAFEALQSDVRATTAFAGISMSSGTTQMVLEQNAREFEYEQNLMDYNENITQMQIADAQEDSRLQAELSRMEGGATAAGLQAQGTASLIKSFGDTAKMGYDMGIGQ
jgi:hypothetical protein|tara:strand:+ start:213 stop:740 length:528 start_codon:yes stop_codon:yes gene_type:complete